MSEKHLLYLTYKNLCLIYKFVSYHKLYHIFFNSQHRRTEQSTFKINLYYVYISFNSLLLTPNLPINAFTLILNLKRKPSYLYFLKWVLKVNQKTFCEQYSSKNMLKFDMNSLKFLAESCQISRWLQISIFKFKHQVNSLER